MLQFMILIVDIDEVGHRTVQMEDGFENYGKVLARAQHHARAIREGRRVSATVTVYEMVRSVVVNQGASGDYMLHAKAYRVYGESI